MGYFILAHFLFCIIMKFPNYSLTAIEQLPLNLALGSISSNEVTISPVINPVDFNISFSDIFTVPIISP